MIITEEQRNAYYGMRHASVIDDTSILFSTQLLDRNKDKTYNSFGEMLQSEINRNEKVNKMMKNIKMNKGGFVYEKSSLEENVDFNILSYIAFKLKLSDVSDIVLKNK